MNHAEPAKIATIIDELEKLRDQAVSALRTAKEKQEVLERKRGLDRAISVLKLAVDLQLIGDERAILLPPCRTATPSSDYRIIEDNETERRELWKEIEIDGERLRLSPGDIVLIRR